jgi:hypothetical protein
MVFSMEWYQILISREWRYQRVVNIGPRWKNGAISEDGIGPRWKNSAISEDGIGPRWKNGTIAEDGIGP